MASLRVAQDAPALYEAAAQEVQRAARAAQARRGRFSLVLCGGRTPRGLYERLAADPEGIDWARVLLFWGDERCVPPDHPDSNYRMTRESLLARVPVPPGNVHRIAAERPPEEAAERYERTLGEALELAPGQPPRFDLVLLGLGADGHTASLFPGSPALEETSRLALPVRVGQAWRITLTPPALLNARRIVVLARGREKAAALARALQVGAQPSEVPARLLHAAADRVLWLADREAAGAMTGA